MGGRLGVKKNEQQEGSGWRETPIPWRVVTMQKRGVDS